MINMRHRAKLRGDWSNRYRDMAIFRFYKTAAVATAILEISKNRHISATIRPISTKFASMLQFRPLEPLER